MKLKFQNQLVLTLFFISSAIVLSLCLYTGNSLYLISKYAYKDTEDRLLSLSRYASEIVTADEIGALQTAADMEKPLFGELRQRLANFAEDNKILYAYYMRNDANGMAQYIIDNDMTEGTVNLSTPPFDWEEKAKEALEGHAAAAEMENYLAGYEHLISAFYPVFDANGSVVAIAGVDIDDQQILEVRKTMNILVPLLSAGVLIVTVCGLFSVLLHRRTDKALKLALENALTASRAKSDFLANMSHEIRTPMNAITGMAAIAESADSAERKDYAIGKIKDASAHLLGIINDILDMSKIEANKLELSPVAFDCEAMLQKVVNFINLKIIEKHQELTVHIDRDIPKKLVCDEQRLAQVITNLLSNAVKFTPEHGSIDMKMNLVKEENDICVVEVDVSDTGVGISKEQQGRLFASFVQAESSTTRKYGGTGLGLAISKRIVEMMGGKIWVNSEPGKGATFGFTIKAHKAPVSEPAEPARPDATRQEGAGPEAMESEAAEPENDESDNFNGYCVLLVEDIEINREIVLALLEPTGLKIICAENGREALRLFTENMDAVDMIFMDLQMPEMDGYETTREIRAMDARKAKFVPIVAMTANVFLEDIEKCKAAGMNDHVGKPLDFDDVMAKLRKYIVNRRKGDNRRKTDRRQSADRRQGERRQGDDRRKADRRVGVAS